MRTLLQRRLTIASLWGDTRGSVLAEAALVMPVMVTVALGAMEFSWWFQKQQLVEAGVRDAARYLSRASAGTSDSEASSPCNDTTSVANARNIAVTGVVGGGTPRVQGWTAGSVAVSCSAINNSSNTYSGPTTIYTVNVSTSFPDPGLGFFSALGLGAAPNLSASHTERSFGPG